MESLKVLLVEDWVLTRRPLAAMLAREMDAKVAACSSRRLIEGSAGVAGRVVLIDAVTWSAGLPALLKVIRKTSPVAPVVLLGSEDHLREHAKAIGQGALALVRITADARVVFRAVGRLRNGRCGSRRGC